MVNAGWKIRGLMFLIFLGLLGLDPGRIYDNWAVNFPMVGFLGFILGPGASLWGNLQGALPINRKSWVKKEILRTTGLMAVLYIFLFSGVALVQGGPGGWWPLASAHVGTFLACLSQGPWAVPADLTRSPDDPRRGLGFRILFGLLGMVVLAILAAGLDTQWAQSRNLGVPAAGIGILFLSVAGAWATARTMLSQGVQR